MVGFMGGFVSCEAVAKRVRRQLLVKRDGQNCFYCGRFVVWARSIDDHALWIATEDHIVPKCYGGSDELDNLVLACSGCNSERGTYPAGVFLVLKMTGGL